MGLFKIKTHTKKYRGGTITVRSHVRHTASTSEALQKERQRKNRLAKVARERAWQIQRVRKVALGK